MWIRRLRWWHVVLVTALAVVGIVLTASWVILRVYGPAFTRERVEALLSEALGQPARVGAVHLRPWRGRVSLVDLDVLPRATPPGGVLLRAPTIDVSVDIASLWRRELTLSAPRHRSPPRHDGAARRTRTGPASFLCPSTSRSGLSASASEACGSRAATP